VELRLVLIICGLPCASKRYEQFPSRDCWPPGMWRSKTSSSLPASRARMGQRAETQHRFSLGPGPCSPGTGTQLPACMGHRRGSTPAWARDHRAFSSHMCTHQSHSICQVTGKKGNEGFISRFTILSALSSGAADLWPVVATALV